MRVLLIGLISASLLTSSPATDETSPRTGVLEGTITYQVDVQRPWRYARHYVNSDDRALAETVVALKAASLDGFPRAEKPRMFTVDQLNFQFTPETITLRVGDSVRFTNSDAATHNVRSSNTTADFNVNLAFGDEYIHTFDRDGGTRRPVPLGCVYHSNMQAWIFVFDHPFHQVTAEDGRFRLDDVAPGDYELEIVHAAGELSRTLEIAIRADETVTRNVTLSPDDRKRK